MSHYSAALPYIFPDNTLTCSIQYTFYFGSTVSDFNSQFDEFYKTYVYPVFPVGGTVMDAVGYNNGVGIERTKVAIQVISYDMYSQPLFRQQVQQMLNQYTVQFQSTPFVTIQSLSSSL